MTERHKSELRYIALAWSLICALGATAGALVGWISWNGRKAPTA